MRTRNRSPQTNGVVERFNQTLKYDHLYRVEVADVLELQDEITAYRELYNWIRPHETLGQVPPMTRYLLAPDEPNLSGPDSVQSS